MLLQKMFAACVYVSYMFIMCMCVRACVCVLHVCARARFRRDDDGSLRRCAPISLDEREKGRERPRREESRDIVKHVHIIYRIPF